jgi:hypothetical protein
MDFALLTRSKIFHRLSLAIQTQRTIAPLFSLRFAWVESIAPDGTNHQNGWGN